MSLLIIILIAGLAVVVGGVKGPRRLLAWFINPLLKYLQSLIGVVFACALLLGVLWMLWQSIARTKSPPVLPTTSPANSFSPGGSGRRRPDQDRTSLPRESSRGVATHWGLLTQLREIS